jgi:hypothetical protein
MPLRAWNRRLLLLCFFPVWPSPDLVRRWPLASGTRPTAFPSPAIDHRYIPSNLDCAPLDCRFLSLLFCFGRAVLPYSTHLPSSASAVRFLKYLADPATATSIVVPSTTPGHMASIPLTNGHSSPDAVDVATPTASSPSNQSELSDTNEPIANGASSDEDAPGEEYDEDEPMVDASDSSEDVDAEGEPDGDYDSETPPPAQADYSRARSSTSQDSQRGAKRKAGDKDDILRNPGLYGLRRSVRRLVIYRDFQLIVSQERAQRARPTRLIVRYTMHTLWISC